MIRGIDSIANATTPAAASRSIPSGSVSGWRKPISTSPGRSRPVSSAVGFCTLTIASAPPEDAVDEGRSCLRERRVGERGLNARALLDEDVEAGPGQTGDDLRNERHAPLAGRGLFRNADPHAAGNSMQGRRMGGEGAGLAAENCAGRCRRC